MKIQLLDFNYGEVQEGGERWEIERMRRLGTFHALMGFFV